MRDIFQAVERLEAERLKAQESKPDRLPILKAARDALLIEAGVALVFTACTFVVLIQQGVIQWP
jgi:hypothetical protein